MSRQFQSIQGPTDPSLRHSEIEGYQPVSRIGEIVINSFGAPLLLNTHSYTHTHTHTPHDDGAKAHARFPVAQLIRTSSPRSPRTSTTATSWACRASTI